MQEKAGKNPEQRDHRPKSGRNTQLLERIYLKENSVPDAEKVFSWQNTKEDNPAEDAVIQFLKINFYGNFRKNIRRIQNPAIIYKT